MGTDDGGGCAGQLGRVGVIGGSEDYTGAPYFSAMASARLGCDMVGCCYSHLLSVGLTGARKEMEQFIQKDYTGRRL